ncbi:hypothetical protein HHI36_020210 [Cryptolaemus montrouzieri]|uniref:Carbonic anhydrase n=1 Tax=Cryptolaemus montrouzieri TaxID=559131 RepID=A0ABD2NAM1_9CUCU
MTTNWGYCQGNGPQTWSEIFPAASGNYQSPVDIKPVDLKDLSCNKRLEWKYTPENATDVTNTGHGWKVGIKQGGSSLSGGPLKSTYELAQFHCHWGETDDQGSEHTIDGKTFAGELHLVHWNSSKYPTFEEAAKHHDGFCVLGLFLKSGAKNEELEKVIAELNKIEYKDQKTSVSPIDPTNLLPKNGGCGYYTYQGSLTTPPCLECVIWIVFKEPIEVSPEQLKAFRRLKFHCKEECCECNDCDGSIKNNFRPTLPLGQREVLEGR